MYMVLYFHYQFPLKLKDKILLSLICVNSLNKIDIIQTCSNIVFDFCVFSTFFIIDSRQADRQAGRQAERQAGRQADRQAGRQAGRQVGR